MWTDTLARVGDRGSTWVWNNARTSSLGTESTSSASLYPIIWWVQARNYWMRFRTSQEIPMTSGHMGLEPRSFFSKIFVRFHPFLPQTRSVLFKFFWGHLFQLWAHIYQEGFHPLFQIAWSFFALHYNTYAAFALSRQIPRATRDDVTELFLSPKHIERWLGKNLNQQRWGDPKTFVGKWPDMDIVSQCRICLIRVR